MPSLRGIGLTLGILNALLLNMPFIEWGNTYPTTVLALAGAIILILDLYGTVRRRKLIKIEFTDSKKNETRGE